MLPSYLSEYLPHAGLVCLLLGIIFSIIAAADAPTKSNPLGGDTLAQSKFNVLAYSFIFVGGFLLLGPVSNK